MRAPSIVCVVQWYLCTFLAESDYGPSSGTLQLTTASPVACVTLSLVVDAVAEPSEVFQVVLSTDNPRVDTSTASITITDTSGEFPEE